MIEGLKPYAEYKESGLSWLERVPSHWRVCRNGNLFAQRNQTGFGELPILEVSLRTGVRVRDFGSSARKQIMSDLGKYKRAMKGDATYNTMRMWQGAVGVSPVDGLVSPAYVVLRPYPKVDSRFYATLFRTAAYMAEVDNCSRGIVKDRNRLYWDQFKQMPSPSMPPDEQAVIVRFLDHANRKIDRFIRAKRKLIALLGEQKQAIIHRAVTRGVDHPQIAQISADEDSKNLRPSAKSADKKLKPSGIPWLGDIPMHWEIVRNMALFSHRVEPGVVGLPVLQVSLRSGITAEELDQFGRPKRLITDATKYKLLRKSDLAYNTMRMWQGAVGVAPSDGLVSSAYVVIKPRVDTCPEFYDFVFLQSNSHSLIAHGYRYHRERPRNSDHAPPDRGGRACCRYFRNNDGDCAGERRQWLAGWLGATERMTGSLPWMWNSFSLSWCSRSRRRRQSWASRTTRIRKASCGRSSWPVCRERSRGAG